MNFDREILLEKLKSHLLPVLIGLIGIILIGVGLVSSSNTKAEDIVFTSGDNQPQISKASKIVVDIEGAVVSPGVYSLENGGRVKDVLIAAMGLSSDADRNWVDKNLNLAAPISDGQKFYVPRIGDKITSQF